MRLVHRRRHCEERSDEAIHTSSARGNMDCFASLAMTWGSESENDDRSMTAPDLPAELRAALDARLQGLSRNDAAERAALISKTYRDGGNSGAIGSAEDALAYALARMNRLFGVTMAERGVSQLVSVDLEDAVKILDQNVA